MINVASGKLDLLSTSSDCIQCPPLGIRFSPELRMAELATGNVWPRERHLVEGAVHGRLIFHYIRPQAVGTPGDVAEAQEGGFAAGGGRIEHPGPPLSRDSFSSRLRKKSDLSHRPAENPGDQLVPYPKCLSCISSGTAAAGGQNHPRLGQARRVTTLLIDLCRKRWLAGIFNFCSR